MAYPGSSIFLEPFPKLGCASFLKVRCSRPWCLAREGGFCRSILRAPSLTQSSNAESQERSRAGAGQLLCCRQLRSCMLEKTSVGTHKGCTMLPGPCAINLIRNTDGYAQASPTTLVTGPVTMVNDVMPGSWGASSALRTSSHGGEAHNCIQVSPLSEQEGS